MSQSRFSIVLVGVSALLRRPLVSRLRPAVFAARGSGGFRRSALPSASGLPLGELTFGLTASAFRHAPLRSGRSAGWPSGSRLPLFGTHRFGDCPRRVGLRAHDFRFSACAASELPSASWFFRLPLRRLPLGGLAFGLTASAFRHAPLRGCRSASWFCRLPFRGCPRRVGSSAFRFGVAARRVGLRTHGFRFLACAASEMAAGRVGLRAHCFRFSARTDPHRRTAEARTDGAQRHDTCFTSKHLSQHVNLPHRTP